MQIKSPLTAKLMEASLELPRKHRRTMVTVRVPMSHGQLDFGLDIREPGQVLSVEFAQVPKEIQIPGQPNFDVVPVLVFDVNPEAPHKHHEYTWVPLGMFVEGDYEITPIGVYPLPGGSLMGLYEKVIPQAMRDTVRNKE